MTAPRHSQKHHTRRRSLNGRHSPRRMPRAHVTKAAQAAIREVARTDPHTYSMAMFLILRSVLGRIPTEKDWKHYLTPTQDSVRARWSRFVERNKLTQGGAR